MLRTSSYTIYVDLPGNQAEVLLVHGYSGAYDKVSRSVAEYLRSLDPEPPSSPLYGRWVTEPAASTAAAASPPSPATLEQLRRRGYLTSKTAREEEGYFARIVKKIHKRERNTTPSYLFMPTYDCNLRCGYCFQDHMRTDPAFSHLLRRMDRALVDRILKAFPVLEQAHGVPAEGPARRRIGFYGGEPFLAANRPIVEYIMEQARALGPVSFWAVSNATELEAYEDLLGGEGIGEIQITLDGPPDEHDRRRIYADGSGSFERIARNIDLCLRLGVSISIRMNLDRENIRDVPRLADVIVERGWDRSPRFGVYTAPIRAANDKTDIERTFRDTWELDEAIDALREVHENMRVIGRPDDVILTRARKVFDTAADTIPQLRASFCGAHNGMYIFDPFGDIYACWERTGDPSIRIGRVVDGGDVVMDNGLTKLWRSRTVASNPTCRKCRYALHCGGGCAILAEVQSGKFFSNHCDGYAQRFRHSVATAYAEHVTGVEVREQARVCDL